MTIPSENVQVKVEIEQLKKLGAKEKKKKRKKNTIMFSIAQASRNLLRRNAAVGVRRPALLRVLRTPQLVARPLATADGANTTNNTANTTNNASSNAANSTANNTGGSDPHASGAVEPYGRAVAWMHWLGAAGMVFLMGSALIAQQIPTDETATEAQKAQRWSVMKLHESVGMCMLFLLVPRLAIKLLTRAPKALPEPTWQKYAATASHATLYGGLFFFFCVSLFEFFCFFFFFFFFLSVESKLFFWRALFGLFLYFRNVIILIFFFSNSLVLL